MDVMDELDSLLVECYNVMNDIQKKADMSLMKKELNRQSELTKEAVTTLCLDLHNTINYFEQQAQGSIDTITSCKEETLNRHSEDLTQVVEYLSKLCVITESVLKLKGGKDPVRADFSLLKDELANGLRECKELNLIDYKMFTSLEAEKNVKWLFGTPLIDLISRSDQNCLSEKLCSLKLEEYGSASDLMSPIDSGVETSSENGASCTSRALPIKNSLTPILEISEEDLASPVKMDQLSQIEIQGAIKFIHSPEKTMARGRGSLAVYKSLDLTSEGPVKKMSSSTSTAADIVPQRSADTATASCLTQSVNASDKKSKMSMKQIGIKSLSSSSKSNKSVSSGQLLYSDIDTVARVPEIEANTESGIFQSKLSEPSVAVPNMNHDSVKDGNTISNFKCEQISSDLADIQCSLEENNINPLITQEYKRQTLSTSKSDARPKDIGKKQTSNQDPKANSNTLVNKELVQPSDIPANLLKKENQQTHKRDNILSQPLDQTEKKVQLLSSNSSMDLVRGFDVTSAIFSSKPGYFEVATEFVQTITGGSGTYFDHPIGCCTLKDGRLVVTDTGNNLVKVMDGNTLTMTIGRKDGVKFLRPSAVVADESSIYVKDDSCIQIFNLDGKHLRTVGAKVFSNPYGLALREVPGLGPVLFVIDARLGNAKLHRYLIREKRLQQCDYDPYRIHGTSFSKLRFFAVHNDKMLTSDLGASALYLSDLDGQSIAKMGQLGRSPGQFMEPSGVAVDDEGNWLVGDSKNNRVQILNEYGHFLATVRFDTPIRRPSGIHLTSNGILYVVNYLDSCIKVFKLKKRV